MLTPECVDVCINRRNEQMKHIGVTIVYSTNSYGSVTLTSQLVSEKRWERVRDDFSSKIFPLCFEEVLSFKHSRGKND